VGLDGSVASAGVQAYNGGLGAEPPEADGILLPRHTFLRCSGACSGSRLTEANILAIAFHQTAKKTHSMDQSCSKLSGRLIEERIRPIFAFGSWRLRL